MNKYIVYTDEELMREVKADNMLAFDVLYKKYSKRLYKFAFGILKSTEESENIIQDVFVNLWENRLNVEKESSIKYYIFTIAHNAAISQIRKNVRASQFIEYLKLQQPVNQEAPSTELEYSELKVRLDDIIDHLPDSQRKVYLMHRVEGLKYKEIADKLHISVNTIENHMSRALKTIREKLGKYSLGALIFCFLFV